MRQEAVRLEDVLEVQNGYAFSSEFFASDAPIGLIRIRDLKRGTTTEVGYVGDFDADYVVNAGDLLVGMDGEFRCYRWAGAPALLNQRVCRLRNFDSRLEPGYLLYSLDFFLKKIEDETGYVTVKHLSSKTIKNIEMLLPPVAEQRRIVVLLDEATQHIADLESAYAQTAALWTDFETAEMSSTIEGLDCPWLSLGECCEILDSLRRPITKRDRRPGPFPYFGATGEVDRVAEYLFDEPLVLLGEDGAKWNRGEKSAFSVDGKCWVNNHAHVLRPLRDVVLDNWLVAYLCHADLSEYITGLTVPKLNQARMREIPIPVPPLAEQEALVARLGVVGEIVARGRVGSDFRLRQLADFRQSVLEVAFRGEL